MKQLSGCVLIFQGLFLGLLLAMAGFKFFYVPQHEIKIDSQVVIEQIQDVAKLVTVQGMFSEVYSYEDGIKMFYDYFEFEKKAITVVNAKAWVSYDLAEMEYLVDELNSTITLTKIPAPEILIEPDFQYYDIDESVMNTFTKEDYNKIYAQSIDMIRQKIKNSDLEQRARQNVVDQIRSMQMVTGNSGWQIIDGTLSIPGVNWESKEMPFVKGRAAQLSNGN